VSKFQLNVDHTATYDIVYCFISSFFQLAQNDFATNVFYSTSLTFLDIFFIKRVLTFFIFVLNAFYVYVL